MNCSKVLVCNQEHETQNPFKKKVFFCCCCGLLVLFCFSARNQLYLPLFIIEKKDNLFLGEVEPVCNFYSPHAGEIVVQVELSLQLDELNTTECSPASPLPSPSPPLLSLPPMSPDPPPPIRNRPRLNRGGNHSVQKGRLAESSY